VDIGGKEGFSGISSEARNLYPLVRNFEDASFGNLDRRISRPPWQSDFARQTAARRLDGWMDFFADDASIIHDGQTVTGKNALRAFYQPVFANKDFSLTWSPTHAEASRDGTLGYTVGLYEARNGTAISRGMYTTVWRKVDGRWKVVLDLGSTARVQSKPQN
jgi:ketosteroid isomerase-like protein